MTRGTLAIFTNEGLFHSIEFNGDMYLEGYGIDAIRCLEGVNNIKEFEESINAFNKSHHDYDDEELVWKTPNPSQYMNMSENYFDTWFSDYVFIKNLKDEAIVITDKNKKEISIEPEEIAVFNFGRHLNISNSTEEIFKKITARYGNELTEEDILYIIDKGKTNVRGVYEDAYDIGKTIAVECCGLPDSLDNDHYVNFERIGIDTINSGDDYLELPSGKYVHVF